jgi:CelD/BcsL family acetyltransferase involved in cellulose biosynthesis
VRECTRLSEVGASEAWDALTARPPASLSGSRVWVADAFAKLHPEAVPFLIAIDIADQLVALLPLALHGSGTNATLRFAGAPHNDLTDMMVLPGHEASAGAAVVQRLSSVRWRGWSVRLNDVDPDGVLASADREGSVLTWSLDSAAPTVDLSGEWRFATSVRRRRQWDRRLRRLRERHEIEFQRIQGSAMLRELPEFFTLREARLRAKGRSLHSPPFAFVESIIHELAPAGACFFMDMLVDGRPAARDLYLAKPPVAMMWLRGLDPKWQLFPCGHLLLCASAEAFSVDGYHILDLGRGDEPYKYLFGAKRRMLLQAHL